MSHAQTDRRQLGAKPSARLGRRLFLTGLIAALAIFCATTARLFTWPASGMPTRVDAIVMPAGPGDRLTEAVRLAREHRASFLVVSRGFQGYGGPCPTPVARVKLICFNPDPASTRGEAELVGKLARTYHWHSITLVTTTAQNWRARQRMEHCFGGTVYVVTVGVPFGDWLGQVAYEWAASMKMVAWQRAC
jgi:uncharacterized SAM-binding protein YcdF (DUF218 family)